MSDQGSDRRAHVRVPYGAWVTFKHAENTVFFLARDLSLGGMFLLSPEPPPLGSVGNLLLVVEGERSPIALQGHVVRHAADDGGFAMIFDSMSEEEAARLLDLVQTLKRRAS